MEINDFWMGKIGFPGLFFIFPFRKFMLVESFFSVLDQLELVRSKLAEFRLQMAPQQG
jgi:hypothetical protein